ncbi:TPA: hypothetical protein ACSP2X_004179 [Aeromonas veronii]
MLDSDSSELGGFTEGDTSRVVRPSEFVHDIESSKNGEANRKLRSRVGIGMLLLIIMINLCTIYIIYNLVQVDAELLKGKYISSPDRAVNGDVVLSLIAGSVTQAAAMFMFVVKYLFADNSQ